jgi:two-component system response regulator PilR (NtrC family)
MSETTALPVLIVEDDAPTRSLLHAVLSRVGYSSAFATNGAEAMRLLRSNDYAVVVLDIMMPEVSGREVIDFIAAESIPIPVVICSAAGPRALAGFDTNVVKAIIRKPFDIDELVNIVRTVARSRM